MTAGGAPRRHGPTEEELPHLVARARAGDPESEQRLFVHLDARISALAKSRIWDPEAARDIAQETLRTVHEKYRSATFEHGFLPWVLLVFRNKTGNYLKTRRTHHEGDHVSLDAAGVEHATASVDKSVAAFDLLESVAKALPKLSPDCRRIFRLLIGGADRDEVHRSFPSERPGTIDSRISRCRDRLLRMLEECA